MPRAGQPANLPVAEGSENRRARVAALADAIVATARTHRRGFLTEDGGRAGFGPAELDRLFPEALAEARRIEPALDDLAGLT